jgi:hypothetical protein
MKDLGFTKPQIERVYELLSNLNDCNENRNSNCKVSSIDMYRDSRNNFVCTYLLRTLGGSDGVQTEIKYVQITPDGEKVDMFDVYSSEAHITRSIATMKNIEL